MLISSITKEMMSISLFASFIILALFTELDYIQPDKKATSILQPYASTTKLEFGQLMSLIPKMLSTSKRQRGV